MLAVEALSLCCLDLVLSLLRRVVLAWQRINMGCEDLVEGVTLLSHDVICLTLVTSFILASLDRVQALAWAWQRSN